MVLVAWEVWSAFHVALNHWKLTSFFRHRFTAGYVSELLINGFKRPHGLLNAYIQHFTGFNVTDASTFVKEEGSDALPLLSQYKLDFSKLKKSLSSFVHSPSTNKLLR